MRRKNEDRTDKAKVIDPTGHGHRAGDFCDVDGGVTGVPERYSRRMETYN
jgi:hypothetical protein